MGSSRLLPHPRQGFAVLRPETALVAFTASFATFAPLRAVDAPAYQTPSSALAQLVDAPATPAVGISPDRSRLLILARADRPGIDELARPELRLAGVRIDPSNNGPARSRHFTGLVVQQIEDGSESRIQGLPEDARIREASWSPDSRHVAFTLAFDSRIELWIADIASSAARRLADVHVNSVLDSGFSWLDDSSLLVLRVPPARGLPPDAPAIPPGPIVQEADGSLAPTRTFQDLLSSAHDEALFDYYGSSELVLVALDGSISSLETNGLLTCPTPSPDRKYLLLSRFVRPYSYIVPVDRFPLQIAVIDLSGRIVRTVADLPLADDIPIAMGSVRKGPRQIEWRADEPATLSWIEALDEGDGGRDADLRDAWFTLAAPFKGKPVLQQTFALRVSDVTWGDARRALVTESWRKTRRTRTWLADPSKPESESSLLFDRSSEDRYSDPGSPVLERNSFDRDSLLFHPDGSTIYLSGRGASPEGDRPFLDAFHLSSRETKRLWQSAPPQFEAFVSFVGNSFYRALTFRESNAEPPNYGIHDFASGSFRPLTRFPHPHPEFSRVTKELIQYPRADGVILTGTLYLPPGYDPQRDGPRPTLVWAYPREFKDAAAASQVRDSPHRFLRIDPMRPLPFLLSGYVVLDDAAMPIVGEGDAEPNDDYVPQLVASAQAAIDELVRRGVTDPDRIAVGGHSYGAFMTANLLAHSRLFQAGIARSGAYNRTLTPFGFQSESRDFWKAPDVYAAMSPFHNAHSIKDPLLLIHGEVDNNSGTFPLQSERLYQALKGLGSPARLVILPNESHGYAARESLLHMLWEMESWLERHLKGDPAKSAR